VSFLARLLGATEKVLNLLAAGAIFVVMVLVTIQITARYLARAIPGIYESAELLMVAIVFLPLAYTQSVRGHVHMELVVNRLSPRWRNPVEMITLLLSLVVFSIITWKSGQNAYLSWRMGDVTMGLIMFPVWPSKMLVPIGSGLLCLRLLVHILGHLVPQRLAAVKG